MFQYFFSFISDLFSVAFIDFMRDFVFLSVFVLVINYLIYIIRGGRSSG